MGVYLVSLDGAEWFSQDEGEGWGAIASGLNDELRRRGLPPFDRAPGQGTGRYFEEKLSAPMEGFASLCASRLSPGDAAMMTEWMFLVPISLAEPILLPIGSAYSEESLVAGAPQVLRNAERLAAAIRLPAEVPAAPHNLDLTLWFMDGEAGELAARWPGPWAADLDTAFHVALCLRAAQHSLRTGSPLGYV
jgi:hypothetical protein